MDHPFFLKTTLRHPGTGRVAEVVRAESFPNAKAVAVAGGRYVLVVASEKPNVQCTEEHARAWIEAGASYVCIWGPASEAVEETFDYATFLPELGQEVPFTLMTTSHKDESLEEALWFAFYNTHPPDDLPDDFDTVIVVVDSDKLKNKCLMWVKENSE